jgi:hypothetical protein
MASFASAAHAASALQSVEVGGRTFGAHRTASGDVVVLELPAAATLVRQPLRAPDCALLDRMLTANAARIERCRAGVDDASSCDRLKRVVQGYRDADDIPSNLEQRFDVVSDDVVIGDDERAQIARALNLDVGHVLPATAAAGNGALQDVHLSVREGGTSWASKLKPFIDVATAPVTVRGGTVHTRDNVVACGILAGDVEVSFARPLDLTAEVIAEEALTPDELLDVHAMLKSAPPLTPPRPEDAAVWKAAVIGFRVGEALTARGFTQAEAQAALRLVIERLFDRGLELKPHVTKDDVTVRRSVEVELSDAVPGLAVFETESAR